MAGDIPHEAQSPRPPRLTAQVAVVAVGRLLNMVLAAGTLFVLARIMPSKEHYGVICQLILLSVVLTQVFALGLPQALYYFLPRYLGGERRGFLTQTLLLLQMSGVLLGLGFYLGADALGHLLKSALLPDLLRIFALYPMATLPMLALEGSMLFVNRPGPVVGVQALARAGMFAALVVPTWLGWPLTQAVALWMGAAWVMYLVALGYILSTVKGLPLQWHRPMLKENLVFSLPLAIVTLLGLSVHYLDRFLVSNLFAAAIFGVYANATMEIPTVTMVTNASAVVLLAEFSRRTSAGEIRQVLTIWHQAMAKIAVVIFASLGFLAFWGHETMRLLYSARFADSGAIFSIYVWGIPLYLFTLQPLFIALGATRLLALLTVINLGLTGVCAYGFSRLFGLPGIALGVIVAGYLGGVIWTYVVTHRLTDIGWRAFLPWGRILLTLGVAVGAGAVSRLLHAALAPHLPLVAVFLLAGLLFLGLYAGTLYGLGLLDCVLPTRLRRRKLAPPIPETTEEAAA